MLTWMMLELADCIGVEGGIDGYYELFGFMMKPNMLAIDNTVNGTCSDRTNYDGGYETSWILPDHALYSYSGTLYDPTFHKQHTGSVSGYENEYIYAIGLNGTQMKLCNDGNNRTITYEPIEGETTHDISNPHIGLGWDKYTYTYKQTASEDVSLSALSSGEFIATVMSFGSSWTAVSNDSWLSLDDTAYGGFQTSSLSAFNGDDEDTIDIIAAPNTSGQLRTGTVTVTSGGETSTITIHQDGIGEWLNISKTAITATANGKEDSFAVTSNVNWYATVDVDVDWIEFAYEHGVGNDTVPVVIQSNTTSEERTAIITISGVGVVETITVTQEAYSASSDATLDDLTISTGDLTPDFNPAIINYTVSVPNSVSSVTLAATANQSGASVSGTGAKSLSVGANNFTITVTALDGETELDYTIVVTREQDTSPVATSVEFDSPSYGITIPSTGNATVTVSAVVKDQYEDEMSGISPTYSLTSSYSGVTINSSTGVVTVSSSATSGTATIRATYGTLYTDVSLSLNSGTSEQYSLQFGQYRYYSWFWEGEESFTVEAYLVDSSGQQVNVQGLEIEYILTNDEGDEFTSDTGEFYSDYLPSGFGSLEARAYYNNTLLTAYVDIDYIHR